MEPLWTRGCNQWQSVANEIGAEAAKPSGIRCHASRYARAISSLFAPSSRMRRQTAKKVSAS